MISTLKNIESRFSTKKILLLPIENIETRFSTGKQHFWIIPQKHKLGPLNDELKRNESADTLARKNMESFQKVDRIAVFYASAGFLFPAESWIE